MLFVHYPKCSTCKKAKKWLDSKGISYEQRDITTDTPTESELSEWYGKSGQPLKKFFNTCGMSYREMNLKDTLPSMSEDEQLKLLSKDGMLIKRPILVGEDFALVGFKEDKWEDEIITADN